MVKIAKSYDKDTDFVNKYEELRSFILTNNRMPRVCDRKPYKFVSKLRSKYRNNPALVFWEWRIPMLLEIGVDVRAGATISKNPAHNNIEPHWRPYLNFIRNNINEEHRKQNIEWFNAIANSFSKRNGFIKQKRYNTLHELFIKWLKVGDINPNECTRDQPCHNLRHTLSYIAVPLSVMEIPSKLDPSWRLKDHDNPFNEPETYTALLNPGNTVFFDSTNFSPSMFKEVLDFLPQWMLRCYEGVYTPKDDDLVRLIETDEVFYDHFPYPIGAQNWRHGTVEITKTKHLRPRRLNLYDKVNNLTYNQDYNCTVQDGYSYTLSWVVTAPMFYGGRCLDEYQPFAKLKVDIWKKVYHWLSPISKLTPPNGMQCLLYVADWNGSIRPHRDMNPSMDVDPKSNSQIIGTSVIVISFFHPQIIQLGHPITKTKFHVHDSFQTEHCSVYVLDPHDDLNHHHTTLFPEPTEEEKNSTRIRYAITLRWLGNRKKFFGPDNQVGLKHCEVHHQPKRLLTNHFKQSQPSVNMWQEAIKNKKKTPNKNIICAYAYDDAYASSVELC